MVRNKLSQYERRVIGLERRISEVCGPLNSDQVDWIAKIVRLIYSGVKTEDLSNGFVYENRA